MAEADVGSVGADAVAGDLARMGALLASAPGVEDAKLTRLGELVVRVRRDGVLPLMTILRDDPRFRFEQCMDLCGVDHPERAERFDVVWNLLSLTHNHRIRVACATDGVDTVPSVSSLWPTATWFEREAWDMFGIVFSDQPDLRRLLTDYGFQGHPLRKDFPLTGHVELRYDPERREVAYEPVQLTQDFRDFDFLSPWEAMTTLPGDEKVHLNRLADAEHDLMPKAVEGPAPAAGDPEKRA